MLTVALWATLLVGFDRANQLAELELALAAYRLPSKSNDVGNVTQTNPSKEMQ